jgi:pyruvate-formate lyase-activating enzyme
MPKFESLEPAIDPNNRITFLLDWEVTLKCNLDCSYCVRGLNGGHDNSTKHPPLEQCLDTVDFLFKYADLYMKRKPQGIKYAVLNVYGGEALNHPNIVDILKTIRSKHKPYAQNWHLTVTTTTNALVSKKQLQQIIPYIDEFTCSYHTEATEKQKQQFKQNLLTIKQNEKRVKCVVLLHHEPDFFNDAQGMIDWLTAHNIKQLPRQLDDSSNQKINYDQQQIKWFNNFYKSKTFGQADQISENNEEKVNLSDTGRACCGGRQLCEDQHYKERKFYVLDNKFTDWYCSVNKFFVFVKQVTGDIYVNKDCKMNFEGAVGPIGHLSNTKELLDDLKQKLDTGTLPVIQCKKYKCTCGLCAPKAQDLTTYNKIMEKYEIPNSNLLS